MQEIYAIIQARMGSTRLPGKVLMEASGKPLLWHMIRQLRPSRAISRIALATTTLAADDPVAALGADLGLEVFRGDESDVLARFAGTATRFGAENIMRLTADCPLVQPDVCDSVAALFLEARADYARTSSRFAEGLDCEVFTRRALDEAHRLARLPSEREHVTLYMRNHPQRFALVTLDQHLADAAGLAGVTVLNLHALAKAMAAPVSSGDLVEVHLARAGKEPGQAVGHLPDGTMVIVQRADHRIGDTVRVHITSVTTTSHGRLVFASLAQA